MFRVFVMRMAEAGYSGGWPHFGEAAPPGRHRLLRRQKSRPIPEHSSPHDRAILSPPRSFQQHILAGPTSIKARRNDIVPYKGLIQLLGRRISRLGMSTPAEIRAVITSFPFPQTMPQAEGSPWIVQLLPVVHPQFTWLPAPHCEGLKTPKTEPKNSDVSLMNAKQRAHIRGIYSFPASAETRAAFDAP